VEMEHSKRGAHQGRLTKGDLGFCEALEKRDSPRVDLGFDKPPWDIFVLLFLEKQPPC